MCMRSLYGLYRWCLYGLLIYPSLWWKTSCLLVKLMCDNLWVYYYCSLYAKCLLLLCVVYIFVCRFPIMDILGLILVYLWSCWGNFDNSELLILLLLILPIKKKGNFDNSSSIDISYSHLLWWSLSTEKWNYFSFFSQWKFCFCLHRVDTHLIIWFSYNNLTFRILR